MLRSVVCGLAPLPSLIDLAQLPALGQTWTALQDGPTGTTELMRQHLVACGRLDCGGSKDDLLPVLTLSPPELEE